MTFDVAMFSDKLRRYASQLEVGLEEVANATGLPRERVEVLMAGRCEPSGDEVLILADYFKCDFKFFISNERLAPFEQTESLFRKHGDILSKEDRWAIQEFLFLCECQKFLLDNTDGPSEKAPFTFSKSGKYYKEHGHDAASALRRHLGYDQHAVPRDVFCDFRRIGIHVFRRRLAQSLISGLFVRHPVAGPCALVNYSEDIYRQRFSAAHEAAHALLDDGDDFSVSFSRWDSKDLSEVRANAFASHFLMPPEFLTRIPVQGRWSEEQFLHWSQELRVNPEPFAYALKDAGLIEDQQVERFRGLKIPRHEKIDPEIPQNLTARNRERRKHLLEKGLCKGELSAIALAQKIGQACLTDDQKARRLAESTLAAGKTQTTTHLVGWLFFERHLTDVDLNVIVVQHEAMERPLAKYFKATYEEACRCRLLASEGRKYAE